MTAGVSVSLASSVGRRDHNEDVVLAKGLSTLGTRYTELAFETSSTPPIFLAAIDGMGGHVGGSHAASIAATVLAQQRTDDGPTLRSAVAAANEEIYEAMERNEALTGMGAAFAGVLLSEDRAWLANVGDCSAYVLRAGFLQKLSIDHTSQAGLLTQSLGGMNSRTAVEPAFSEVVVEAGDLFLVCTDGLTDGLEFSDLQAMCADAGSLTDLPGSLITAAVKGGSKDNISVALVCVAP